MSGKLLALPLHPRLATESTDPIPTPLSFGSHTHPVLCYAPAG